jgi:hypothetical protein
MPDHRTRNAKRLRSKLCDCQLIACLGVHKKPLKAAKTGEFLWRLWSGVPHLGIPESSSSHIWKPDGWSPAGQLANGVVEGRLLSKEQSPRGLTSPEHQSWWLWGTKLWGILWNSGQGDHWGWRAAPAGGWGHMRRHCSSQGGRNLLDSDFRARSLRFKSMLCHFLTVGKLWKLSLCFSPHLHCVNRCAGSARL